MKHTVCDLRDTPPACRVVLLIGESGAGKTTWLAQQIHQLRQSNLRVVGVLSPIREDGRRCLTRLSTDECRCHQLNDLQQQDEIQRETRRRQEQLHLHAAGNTSCADEVNPRCTAVDNKDGTVVAGPFLFDAAVFAWAREELALSSQQPDWVVVDEVGPLELKRRVGLEPAVGECLALRRIQTDTRYVIVVRPSLKDTVIAHYQIHRDECVECVISQSETGKAR